MTDDIKHYPAEIIEKQTAAFLTAFGMPDDYVAITASIMSAPPDGPQTGPG